MIDSGSDDEEDLNFREKYQQISNIIFKVYVSLTDIGNFLEGVIQLCSWEDRFRTQVFLLGIVVVISLVKIVTFRAFLMVVIANEFYDGLNIYKSIYKRNKKLVKWTLNYVIKRHCPKYHEFFLQSVPHKLSNPKQLLKAKKHSG